MWYWCPIHKREEYTPETYVVRQWCPIHNKFEEIPVTIWEMEERDEPA